MKNEKAYGFSNYFVTKSLGEKHDLTPMAVQKLLYFSHALMLIKACDGNGLGKNPFGAWHYGPVLAEMYHHFKHNEDAPVKEIFSSNGEPVVLEAEEEKVAHYIWNVFGKKDAYELSALTHEEGSPWDNHYNPTKINKIPDDEIIGYYKNTAWVKNYK
jgi:uncharacterized phage-associated protein